MVRLLKLVEEGDVVRVDVASPLQIEVLARALEHAEARALAAIHKRVVYVGVITYFKRHEQSFHFVPLKLPDSVALAFYLHVRWILEEGRRRSILKNGVNERNIAGVGLEHAIR